MRGSEATSYGPHRRKRTGGKFSLWLGTQPEDKRSQSRSGGRMETKFKKTTPAWDVKKVRGKSEVIRQAPKG